MKVMFALMTIFVVIMANWVAVNSGSVEEKDLSQQLKTVSIEADRAILWILKGSNKFKHESYDRGDACSPSLSVTGDSLTLTANLKSGVEIGDCTQIVYVQMPEGSVLETVTLKGRFVNMWFANPFTVNTIDIQTSRTEVQLGNGTVVNNLLIGGNEVTIKERKATLGAVTINSVNKLGMSVSTVTGDLMTSGACSSADIYVTSSFTGNATLTCDSSKVFLALGPHTDQQISVTSTTSLNTTVSGPEGQPNYHVQATGSSNNIELLEGVVNTDTAIVKVNTSGEGNTRVGIAIKPENLEYFQVDGAYNYANFGCCLLLSLVAVLFAQHA